MHAIYKPNPVSVECTYFRPSFWIGDDNLHHGRFLFRHKGKKQKGKPNYPPTKLIVKTRRQWAYADRGWRIREREERRRVRREYTEAIKKENARKRRDRLIARSPNVVHLFVDKHSRLFSKG